MAIGRIISNIVPLPSSLSIRIPPLCPRTIPSTAGSPRPRPKNFVVKNGSKIRDCKSFEMPVPVSLTCTKAYFPGESGRFVYFEKSLLCSRSSNFFVRMVINPGSVPIASPALMIRFMITCWICPISPMILGGGEINSCRNSAVLGMETSNI